MPLTLGITGSRLTHPVDASRAVAEATAAYESGSQATRAFVVDSASPGCACRTDALGRARAPPVSASLFSRKHPPERLVFEGARSVLDRADAPLVMYEADARSARAFGQSMSSATEWLATLSSAAYQFFHVQPDGNARADLALATAEHDHFNLLAVPGARAGRLR